MTFQWPKLPLYVSLPISAYLTPLGTCFIVQDDQIRMNKWTKSTTSGILPLYIICHMIRQPFTLDKENCLLFCIKVSFSRGKWKPQITKFSRNCYGLDASRFNTIKWQTRGVVSSLYIHTLHLPSGEISPTRFRCCSLLLTAFGALAKLYGSLSTSISALKVCCKVQFSKKNLKDFKGCKLNLLPPIYFAGLASF